MDPADTQLSHAILNPATAALQGELAYARAMARFTKSEKALRLVHDVTSLLEETRTWWKDLSEGIPLARKGPELTADGRRICTLLEEAVERWSRLADRIHGLGPAAVDAADADTLRLLVAANADRAFYAYQIVAGTVAGGRMMGDSTIESRASGRTAECATDVRVANAMTDQLGGGGALDEDLRDTLAGRVLALPTELRLRAVEARRAIGLVTGRYGYAEAGLPENEIEAWKGIGLAPFVAAQWHAAGFPPAEAIEWARARLDPATAAVYRRQGVTLEEIRRRQSHR